MIDGRGLRHPPRPCKTSSAGGSPTSNRCVDHDKALAFLQASKKPPQSVEAGDPEKKVCLAKNNRSANKAPKRKRRMRPSTQVQEDRIAKKAMTDYQKRDH